MPSNMRSILRHVVYYVKVIIPLRRRRWCEETAARTVRTPAAPELAVGRRLSFAEWHHLVELRPNAGKRALDDHVALAGHHHALFRHDEAIPRAAAPFAGGVAMIAAADPGIVGEGVPTHARRQHDCSNQDSHWRRLLRLSVLVALPSQNGRWVHQSDPRSISPTAACDSSAILMGSNMPKHGFRRCDGHHEMVVVLDDIMFLRDRAGVTIARGAV